MSGDALHATAYQSLVHRVQIRRDIPNPAAGQDFSITVPSGEDWRFLGLVATLTCSAAAANRVPSIAIDDQTSIGSRVTAGFGITATSVDVVCFGPGSVGPFQTDIGGVLGVGMPTWVVPTAWRIRVITASLQAADQWSNISYMVEILSEPPWRNPMVGTAYDDEIQHEIAQQMQGG